MNLFTHQSLFEKYRPATWGDFIGNEKAISSLQTIGKRLGFAGRAYWISGKSGLGKTTLARLIAGEVAIDFNTEELDASALTASRISEMEQSMQCVGMFGGESGRCGRAFIVNEAHGLSNQATRLLLTLLERLPSHVVVIFTTTSEGQLDFFDGKLDAGPLLSRCRVVNLTNQGIAKPFSERALTIAESEGLLGEGKSEKDALKLVQACKNNLRAVLTQIEGGALL